MGQYTISPGQRWTFVNDSPALNFPERGARTEYVVEHVPPEPYGAAERITMLNPATGKHSQPTVFWLLQGVMDGRPHWVRTATAEDALAA